MIISGFSKWWFLEVFLWYWKLNSIQNDVFWCPGVTGTLPKWFWINLGWLTFFSFFINILPPKNCLRMSGTSVLCKQWWIWGQNIKVYDIFEGCFQGFQILTDRFLKFDQGCQSWDLFIIFKYDEISSMWGITLWAGYLLYESFKEDKWTI